ncbi:hypothetical protein HA402_004986 [Bradysia odoriphaga]|nr:hypothetical protein HA402_004986 [Bradysia odoriphaga]
MSKSGEILRIGHGSYSFLCIHCGFNFDDINEILSHIDYHFDILDNKIATTADNTNVFNGSTSIGEDVDDYSLEKLSAHQSENTANIQTDFKFEGHRVTKTDPDEIPLDFNTLNATGSAEVSTNVQRNNIKSTAKVKSKRKIDVPDSCSFCQLTFNNSSDCKSHLRDVHQILDKTFECYICGFIGKSITALRRHFGSGLHSKTSCYLCESEPVVRNEWDPRPHKCCLCSSWFENHVQFRKHFRDEHDEDAERFFSKKSNISEYICYICRKGFIHKYYLRSHMIVHSELKAFVCDVCGKTYRTKAILKRHLNVHEGKTYHCEECGKTFPYYARLRIHRYSHRTELNHICKVCSKAFKVQKYLARHMKVHQEEKAYACRYCGKRFTFSTGRRAHEISQHNAI